MKHLIKHKGLIFILILFAIVYSLISLVNHYNFRTYALDLGAYTNALFDYIHFRWNDSGVFNEVRENLLADHFDFYLIVFSPFALVFGTYTLLIIQIAALLFGGVGVFVYFKTSEHSAFVATLASVYFYVFFGIFSAVSYDYHSNVVAAAVIPWFFYLIKQKKLLCASLLLVFILVSKENISLWVVFICFGLAIEYRNQPRLRNYLFLTSALSGVYFFLITSIVMPSLSNEGYFPHFHYSFLGNNVSEAVLHLIQHPVESLKVLFINHLNHPNGNFVKAELHLLLLFSGLPLLVRKPQYLIMLLPIYGQKFFHDSPLIWGVGGQYSVEFAPILAIGIFSVIVNLKNEKTKKILITLVLIGVVGSTIRVMDNTVQFTNKTNIRFYKKSHYQKDYDVGVVHQQLKLIPESAAVSAQSPFVPHLALRNSIYQFPMIKDADYIVFSEKENSYPLTQHDFDTLTTALKQSKEWEVVFSEDVTVLKRTANNEHN